MALVEFPSPSGAHKGTTGFVSIRDSVILTASYVATDHVEVGAYWSLALDIAFTLGSVTSCEIKMQYSNDGGTTWKDVLEEGSPTTGVYSPVLRSITFTANAAGGLVYDVTPFELVRFAADTTGGTLTGSLLALSVAAGIIGQDSL